MYKKRDSVHLRTLNAIGVDFSKETQNIAIPSAIKGESDAQDVTGLVGRLKLQKVSENVLNSRNWMDTQRQYLQAYEYLCRIGEAKDWMEQCLGKTIAPITELEESLRNGVALAQLARVFYPELVPRIFEAPRLQFRHSDNINRFFKFVDKVNVPQNFRFELTDLYEKKNIPKVIYCIHALSFIMANAGLSGKIGSLVGKLEFTEAEIRKTQRSLDAVGASMPNFKGVAGAISGEVEDPVQIAEASAAKEQRLMSETTPSVKSLQAHARGMLLRQRLCIQLARLEMAEVNLIAFQAHARGYLLRRQYFDNAVTYNQINEWCIALQASGRGYLSRSLHVVRAIGLEKSSIWARKVQQRAQGYLSRARYLDQLARLSKPAIHRQTMTLQALIIGRKVRFEYNAAQSRLATSTQSATSLQRLARGKLQRDRCRAKGDKIRQNNHTFPKLQAHVRGFLIRQAQRRTSISLHKVEVSIVNLQASVRGAKMRCRIAALNENLENVMAHIEDCQAQSRAFSVRRRYRSIQAFLDDHEDDFIAVQAYSRAMLYRRKYHAKLRHYRSNMQQVIKVQSFVRARQQGAAYRSLTLDENPPIATVKNFIHLLSDSNHDFDEEIAMEQVRKSIVQSVRQNEAAEEHIEQMDIKIALLVKQVIKIDEVIQHQKRLDRGLSFSNKGNPFDLKALNKVARRQLENYQKFFYVLQTQPLYLARLFTCAQRSGINEKDLKTLETFIMVLYGYAQKRREEFFLLRLVRVALIKEISESNGIPAFISGSYIWSKILVNYLRSTNAGFLCNLLRSTIELIVHDDKIDLQCDPVKLYHRIYADGPEPEEGQIQRTNSISYDTAIQDPEVRPVFINHLRNLRDLTEKVLDALQRELRNAPYGLRYIAREAYRAMEEHLVDETEEQLNIVVGNLVFSRYVAPALVNPEYNGIINTGISPMKRQNLAELAKVLTHVFSAQLLPEGHYLQPLNEFVHQSIDKVQHILRALVQVPDAETQYNISEMDDLTATKRPILYIKATDIFAIHSMLFKELPEIVFDEDDPLEPILQALGAPPDRVEDMMLMSLSSSEIALTLDPSAVDVDDPEAEERQLFMQTKRLLLYVIRIQSGNSLLEILVEPVSKYDEQRWQEIVQEEAMLRSNSPIAPVQAHRRDLTNITYADLKRECLENIIQLEKLGWLSRDDHYQELLNRIADDIRTQNRRRIERQVELRSAQQTLQSLTEKREYLNAQLSSYNDYIEQAMTALQSKKSRKKSIIPFSKQYFHMRDLQKAGNVPQFGSRKYSASKLYQKGILMSIANESPPFDRIDLTISSDQVGLFTISSTYQNQQIPGALASLNLDDLLQAQYNKVEGVDIFDAQVKLRVTPLLSLIFKHFFAQ